MSMNFVLFASSGILNSVILFLICECKSKKFFPNYQNFFEVFFRNLEIVFCRSLYLTPALLLLSNRDCKSKKLFLTSKIFKMFFFKFFQTLYKSFLPILPPSCAANSFRFGSANVCRKWASMQMELTISLQLCKTYLTNWLFYKLVKRLLKLSTLC